MIPHTCGSRLSELRTWLLAVGHGLINTVTMRLAIYQCVTVCLCSLCCQ